MSAISDASIPRSAPPWARDQASPASACSITPAHAASNGDSEHAIAATMPPRTSPEPAVASAGHATGETASGPSGDATIGVGALEHDDGTGRRRELARGVEAVRLDLRRGSSEQARGLARVRREDGLLRGHEDASAGRRTS